MHTSHAGRNGRNKRAGGVKTDGRTSTVAHRREIARSNDRNYVLDLTGGSWSTLYMYMQASVPAHLLFDIAVIWTVKLWN